MSFTCPSCGATSHNPTDEAESYCGRCHAFVMPPTVKQLGDPRGGEATWTLMPAPPGVCSQCGREHDPELPHDRESMRYGLVFAAEHGRAPTWADAMAHCSPATRAAWGQELRARGVEVGD